MCQLSLNFARLDENHIKYCKILGSLKPTKKNWNAPITSLQAFLANAIADEEGEKKNWFRKKKLYFHLPTYILRDLHHSITIISSKLFKDYIRAR